MSSDFRGTGDDTLPAPAGQPQQSQPGLPVDKKSEDSGIKEPPFEKEKPESVEAESDDDKTDDGDAPAGATLGGAPPPPDAAPTSSPAQAALMKQVNAVLSSEVIPSLARRELNQLLTLNRLVLPLC